MDKHDPRSNDPRPDFKPIPIHDPKPAKKPILYFVAGFLLASLVGGAAFTIGIGFSQSSDVQHTSLVAHYDTVFDVVQEIQAPIETITAIAALTPLTSTDVNNLRFAAEDVTSMHITTQFGDITIGLHDEDFISVHSTQTAAHNHDKNSGTLWLDGVFGNFVILLPSSSDPSLQNLRINSPYGDVFLTNLVVAGTFDVQIEFGTINTTNILSNPDTTNIRTGDFGRFVAN
ncbi:MAG: hypothetical protein FWE21_01195 [Defluviitaleaceae bacterium]|nr:hypothetical protein [Defluviitaleaceae bacterium]